MTTTKIKCACNWLGCKASIKINEDNMLYVYEKKSDRREVTASVFLLPPIAKAIRDACKIMEDKE